MLLQIAKEGGSASIGFRATMYPEKSDRAIRSQE
jgi:hypothetical protein